MFVLAMSSRTNRMIGSRNEATPRGEEMAFGVIGFHHEQDNQHQDGTYK
jgi:hypothetical protein